MKIDFYPKTCNICGGDVEYVRLTKVYGRHLKYGVKSGYCYHCKNCGATVGTHITEPRKAYGILANQEMATLRQRNHNMFDKMWKNRKQRTKLYQKLADEMGIEFENCHFGYFNVEELEKSYQILLKWWRNKYDR